MTAPARHWIETASLVLAKCAGLDIWFPNVSDAAVLVWAGEFATSGLDRADLLAGVSRAYRNEPEGYRPTPGSLIRHARAAYYETLRDLPDERRAELDYSCHVLQDIGVPIPLAHKVARLGALGRAWRHLVDEDQARQLIERMAHRPVLTANPPRAIAAAVEPYRQLSGAPPRHSATDQPAFRTVA